MKLERKSEHFNFSHYQEKYEHHLDCNDLFIIFDCECNTSKATSIKLLIRHH